ncbi:MAG: hypothetical protein U1G07_18955 [Verrucomicrobiota bacterium]
MGTVNFSNPNGPLRGKVGGLIYALQPNGTVTVRAVGAQRAPSTEREKKGQGRMKLGHDYVHGVLGDPASRAAYACEAQRRKMRTCDLAMSDFLTDPRIVGVDASKYKGRAGGCLLIITGDDFKVVRVVVAVRNGAGQRVEEGFAVPAQGGAARVWIYTARHDLPAGQNVVIEIMVADRAGHSTVLNTTQAI